MAGRSVRASCLVLFAVCVVLISLSGCGGGGNPPAPPPTPTATPLPAVTWTWMGGSKNFPRGHYGEKGVPDPANVPEARNDGVSVVDHDGNFWFFSGNGWYRTETFGTLTVFNDLWRYQPATGLWTWMSGSNFPSEAGTYGELGVPDPSNVPGTRIGHHGWADDEGNLWFFGGLVCAEPGTLSTPCAVALFNDLWAYSTITGNWTWMSGSSTPGAAGVYGTRGVPSETNIPGAREVGAYWKDSNGNFWLFGGYGFDADGKTGDLSDLWKFSPSTHTWTWVGGSNTVNAPGSYGVKGIPAATNMPPTRFFVSAWSDANGNLWMFGGVEADWDKLNDLWKFDTSTGLWTWISGSNQPNPRAVYGLLRVPDKQNVPGGRDRSVAWTDASGNLWLFGGVAIDSTGASGGMNDLWRYSPADDIWTWMGGSDREYGQGVYGTLGVGDVANIPPARMSSMGWTDANGDFWLMGSPGNGNGSSPLNDLWRCQP